MKTAIVHDWLTVYAGAERVLEHILAQFPDADLFCLVDFLLDEYHGFILNKKPTTSIIQRLPFAKQKYRNYLPLMPVAIEHFNLQPYDLIISSSHAVAKGVRKRPGQLHICYCHTPIRYAWDLRDQYLRESGLDKGLKGVLANFILDYVRRWDASTAERVDHYIANSYYIADRIKRIYGRESTVIYPPVDVNQFSLSTEKEDFYLAASRMVPYKRMDLIVEMFSALPEKRLVVIGDGPDFHKVKAKAASNVAFLGYQSFEILRDYMQRAKAFVFAAEEDFGIIPVEAQACGTPVIAYGRGGSLETIIPLNGTNSDGEHGKPTGVFFHEQSVEALKRAVSYFEENRDKFSGQHIRENAIRFSVERFQREFRQFVDQKTAEWSGSEVQALLPT